MLNFSSFAIMAAAEPPEFLVMFHAFSAALVFITGLCAMASIAYCNWRTTQQPVANYSHLIFGWIYSISMFCVAITALPLNYYQPNLLMVGMVMFAISLVVNGIRGARRHRLNRHKDTWWISHMRHMLGSFTIMVMVYVVLNFESWPILARWVIPGIGGLLVMELWIWIYRHRSNSQAIAING